MYLWLTRYMTRFAIAGSRFKDLGEGIACHRDEPTSVNWPDTLSLTIAALISAIEAIRRC
jgi:hypothetical protein